MRLDALIIYSPEHITCICNSSSGGCSDYVDFSLKGRKNMNYFLSGSSHFVTIPFLSLKGDEKF